MVSVLKELDWDSDMDKVCELWEVGAMLLIPGAVDCAEVVVTGGAIVLVNAVVPNEAVVGLLRLVVDDRLDIGLTLDVALVLPLWLAPGLELDPWVGTVVVGPVSTAVAIPSVTVLVPPPFSARNWQVES